MLILTLILNVFIDVNQNQTTPHFYIFSQHNVNVWMEFSSSFYQKMDNLIQFRLFYSFLHLIIILSL